MTTERNPRPSRVLLLACLLGLLTAGCSVGPTALQASRSLYNEAVNVTTSEEFLLNIVRLRYADSHEFLQIGTLTSQFQFNAGLGLQIGDGSNGTGSVGFESAPTLSFIPRDSQEFITRLLSPVSLDGIAFLMINSPDADCVLRLTVRSMNGLENFNVRNEQADHWAESAETFARVTGALGALWSAGKIEFEQVTRDTTKSPPVPAASVTASDIMSALDKGYEFKPTAGDTMTLMKGTPTFVVRFGPEALASPERATIFDALRLDPARNSFDIIAAAEGEQPVDAATVRSRLVISPASVLGTMAYLSYGVVVPEAHVQDGIAKPIPALEKGSEHVTSVVDDIFRVHASKSKPVSAAVAAQYRGYWFYIDDHDLSSKETFSVFQQLFQLEISGERAATGPVLTLPVGR